LLILAFDVGSSSTRTSLFDERGHRYKETAASVSYNLRYTSDGGAEISPLLLRRAAERCLAETLQKRSASALRKMPITAAAASSFWHALLGLDRHGRPITPVFTWADSRASSDAAWLREKFSERAVHARTGCMLRSTFWPSKILWIKRTRPKLFRQIETWASPVDWIFRELFGTSETSDSMASATGLYNFALRTWDERLCDVCEVDGAKLPSISAQSESRSGVRVFHPIGDGAAGNLGSGASQPGIIAINVGTSAAARMVQLNQQVRNQAPVPFGLFRYVVDARRSVVGGAVSNAGNLRVWCLRELRLREGDVNRALSRTKAVADALNVLPFWVNERAPTWPEQQLGVIEGVSQSTRATDILRTTTTAVFYRLSQIIELLEAGIGCSRQIIVSGGIVHSLATIKLLADALGRNVIIAREREASLRGAALHSCTQLGIKLRVDSTGRLVRCNPALAAKHQKRRDRQAELESILTSRFGKGHLHSG
jgi:gluconokinase